jgi:2-methylcitrate dehydratase PrpD
MGTVLAMIAMFRRAGLAEFERHFRDPGVVAFRSRVEMVRDAEIEAAYPQRWVGKVEVETTDGRILVGRVEEPKGDPGNTLTRSEITDKALRLAEFSGAATPAEMRALCTRVFDIASAPRVSMLLVPVEEPGAPVFDAAQSALSR